MTSLPILGEHFLKNNMKTDHYLETKKSILKGNYIQGFKLGINEKNYLNNEIKSSYKTNKTFDNYYKFKDYAFIKDIVKNERVMSVGLDPMVAVMSNIRVIDGYHNIYPLSYKVKFRKIIERELEKNTELKNYYDNWGSRIYAFYNNEDDIVLNFQAAKTIGANYIISKFPLKNKELKIICNKCNNSNEIFLYKIL